MLNKMTEVSSEIKVKMLNKASQKRSYGSISKVILVGALAVSTAMASVALATSYDVPKSITKVTTDFNSLIDSDEILVEKNRMPKGRNCGQCIINEYFTLVDGELRIDNDSAEHNLVRKLN